MKVEGEPQFQFLGCIMKSKQHVDSVDGSIYWEAMLRSGDGSVLGMGRLIGVEKLGVNGVDAKLMQ